MSKYTTEVRFICETANGLVDSKGYTSIQDILETAAPAVFDFDFPIFDESYRKPLEVKILRHYYTREISEETVGLWKLRLADRMNIIMPYYNKLYESELLKFNPFYDVDLTTIHKKDFAGNQDTSRDGSGSEYGFDTKDKKSSTNGEVAEGVKLTNVTHDESENKDDISKNGNRNTDTTSAVANTRTNNETVNANESHDDTTVGSIENNGSSSSTTNNNNESVNVDTSDKWDLYSDTPQGGIDGIENAASGVAGLGYLTNARNNKDETLIKSKGNANTTASGEEKKNEESFTKNDGTNNSISTTSGEITDEGIGTNKVIDSNAENENRIGTSEKSGFSKSDKETIGSNNTTTTDSVEGFNSVKRENKDKQTIDINNTEEYVEHIVGKQGIRSYSKLLEEFRSTFLNIDKMIIDELSDLFFGLWE